MWLQTSCNDTLYEVGEWCVADHVPGETVCSYHEDFTAMVQCGFDSQAIIARIQAVEPPALGTVMHLETLMGIACNCHKSGQGAAVWAEVEKERVPCCLAAAGPQPAGADHRFLASALRSPRV